MKTHARTLSLTAVVVGLGLIGGRAEGAFDPTGWGYRMPITFTNDARLNTLTNFPALIVLDTNKVSYSQFAANGQDLRFADQYGVELSYEVESWSATTNSYVWVKITNLTAGCTINAYLGNASATLPAYRTNGTAWDSTFAGVWHLGEVGNTTAGGYKDATTVNNATGVAMVPGTEVASMISTGQNLNGTSQEIQAADSTSLRPTYLTMSAWIKPAVNNWNPSYTHLLIKQSAAGATGYGLWIKSTGQLYFETAGGNLTGTTILSPGVWYHVAATYDGINMRLYLNGAQESFAAKTGAIAHGAYPFRIGHGPFNNWFNGIMDEPRVSNVGRSANWIWAEYANVAQQGSFVTCGTPTPVSISNLGAANERLYSATFRGTLAVPSTNAAVYVHWGTTDGTNNPAAWTNTAYLGSWTNVASTNISFSASGLTPNTTNYYTFRATNDATNVWASPSTSFSTLTPTVFTENFNTYSGTQNASQQNTGLPVSHTGSVAGWSKSGAGTMHAVNLGGGNMAIMFYQDNVITLTTGIAANGSGVTYRVEFDYGTAVYADISQKTEAADSLLVEVLRADNSVLASGTYTPGAWANPANVNLSAGLHGTLQYVGDGSGVVRLRIGPTPPLTTGRFEGEIDNLKVTVYAATKLAFTTQPGNGTTVSPLAVQPVVALQDVNGNTVTTETSVVTLAIGTDAGPGATLSGTLSQAAVAGVASFGTNALSIDKVGTGYTLLATAGSLTSATSAAFNVESGVGAPAKLAFTTQPSGGANHVAWGTQPAVTLQDAAGLTVTGVATNVTVAILNNAGPGGVLSGTLTQAVNPATGVATFSALSIDKIGTGYTLSVSASGLTSATSAVFNITAGPAAQLAFTTQPTSGYTDSAFLQLPAVTLQDAYGYTVIGTAQNVTLAIQNNAGPGAVLNGTKTVAVNTGTGVATFGGLSLDKAGAGYTLTATGSTVNTAPGVVVSSAFNITAGTAWSLANDFTLATNGNSSTWSFRLGSSDPDPKPTQLLTTNTRNANQLWSTDFATPPTMWSDATSYYGIGKNTTGVTQTRSIGPDITWAPYEVLLWPKATLGGAGGVGTFPGRVVISWLAPFSTTVNIDYSWGTATGSGNGVGLRIWHESTVLKDWSNPYPNPDSGSISNLAVAAGDRLYFEYDSWGNADSAAGDATRTAITITTLPAAKLAFTTQPGNGAPGSPLTTQPVVEVQDAYGKRITKDASTVTLGIGTDAGPGATLGGTPAQAAVAGTANFTTNALSIDKAGNGYTLVATAGSLANATSAVFNVVGVGAPAKLAFTTQPGGGANHVAWGTQPEVLLQDANGLTVTGVAQNLTLAISNNAAGNGVLSGTLTVAANPATGVATFSGLSIDKPGTGYTLLATAGSLTNAVSAPFNIAVGPAAQLAFTTQPGNGYATLPFSTQPRVTLQDAYGYTVTGTAQNVTLAIQNNAGPGGVLSGTLTVAVDTNTGVATSSGLRIDKTGTGYTLTATGSTVNTTPGVVVSGAFNVTPNPYVFFEDFNGYSGTQNTNQYQAGFPVAYGGNVTGWTTSGDGTMHAVNLDGAGNWAIMFWQNNVITLTSGIDANSAGVPYVVEFDYGTAVYHTDGAFQRTQTGDGLKVEVLRADNSVLASQSFFPGAWDTSGNRNLDAGLHGTLDYTGDGSGNVRLKIGPDGTYDSGRFEGEIDNLAVKKTAAGTVFVFR